MNKLLIALLFIIGINTSFSQISDLVIITKENDTLKNVYLRNGSPNKIQCNLRIQEKLVISNGDGNEKELLPSDVTSFSLRFKGELLNYESVEGKGFAQIMYSNKLKLFRFIKMTYGSSINYYIIKRPNNGKISYMEAMGLSRLISEKVIKRELNDCAVTLKKVEDDELKVHGEEGVIELVKDYESNCI